MKFLVDNQLPAALARWLASHGHEALHVLELGLGQAEDQKVAEHAAETGAVLVAKDADFPERSVFQDTPQIVWVRLGNCRNEALIRAFSRVLAQLVAELSAGSRVVELR